MILRTLSLVGLILVSQSVVAQWTVGAGASRMYNDFLELELVSVSASYRIHVQDGLQLHPQIKLGTGVTDYRVRVGLNDFSAELDQFAAISIRGQYELTPRIYGFIEPVYGYSKVSAQNVGVQGTSEAWELGIGGGVGVVITDSISAELQSETIDDTGIFSANLRFQF